MAVLSVPSTDLDGFVRGLAATAPRSRRWPAAAELARDGADTFAALTATPTRWRA